MHRLLAALLGFHRSFSQVSHDRFWRWLAGSAAPDMAAEPVAPASTVISAPIAEPVAATTTPAAVPAPPQRPALRMRTAPGDIRHAVISGPLSEVCVLLEKLALDQESTESLAVTMH
ncbi:MAG: hypothetical protein RLY71_3391 [Pseudomonadota bacterium]|jgi:hypothetical protein